MRGQHPQNPRRLLGGFRKNRAYGDSLGYNYLIDFSPWRRMDCLRGVGVKWGDGAVCRCGTSGLEVTSVPGQQTPSSQQMQGLTPSPVVPIPGDPLNPLVLPTLSLPFPISEHRFLGCYLVQTLPTQLGRLRPGEAGRARVIQRVADQAGPPTPFSPHDPGSGLQISTVPSSFPSDFPCPLPRLPGTPVPPGSPGPPGGHLLHAVSGRGHGPGHYVMIR